MDNLYLLLITNRASNIVEDLETLRLLSKGYSPLIISFSQYPLHACMYFFTVVPSVAGSMTASLTEDEVMDKSFELLFAFDEVLLTCLTRVLLILTAANVYIGYHIWRLSRTDHFAANSHQHGHGEPRREVAQHD